MEEWSAFAGSIRNRGSLSGISTERLDQAAKPILKMKP